MIYPHAECRLYTARRPSKETDMSDRFAGYAGSLDDPASTCRTVVLAKFQTGDCEYTGLPDIWGKAAIHALRAEAFSKA